MGYNMSKEFLFIHRDLVQKFIGLANNNGEIAYRCDNPQEITDLRYQINNILASLARWEPDKEYVRKVVRTWVRYNPEQQCYLLHVGVPIAGTRGRKPSTEYKPLEGVAASGDSGITIKEEITADNYADIMFKLSSAVYNNAPTIVINKPPPAEGVEYIKDKLQPQYKVIDSSTTPLVFERVRA